MLNGLLRFAEIRQSRSWLRLRAGRLLSGLSLTAGFPLAADAARKGGRRDANEDHKDNAAKETRNDGGGGGNSSEDKNSSGNSDEAKNSDAKSEDNNSSGKASKEDETRDSEKSDRRSGQDEGGDRDNVETESDRQTARRQDSAAEAEDSSSKNDRDESDDGGGRRSQEFEQSADAAQEDVDPTSTVAAPTNPNVVVTDVPEVSEVDLVVEANPDVIASVSSSGGFAFARSGGVTAVTGPDGASIIQSGDGETAAAPLEPTDVVEPSDDGGNNDLDFSS